MCRGELPTGTARLMPKCLWSGWKWYWGVKEIPSPFHCSPVIRRCSWKKTQIEKKKIWRQKSHLVQKLGLNSTIRRYLDAQNFWHIIRFAKSLRGGALTHTDTGMASISAAMKDLLISVVIWKVIISPGVIVFYRIIIGLSRRNIWEILYTPSFKHKFVRKTQWEIVLKKLWKK